ncbi:MULTISPECIES: hypothetical protein [Methanobacterium]|jgi:hypothetical protein|uniref:Uncharacterized protein n=1 Tax=Methanobacterium veterum TaxID=408577 RepID=A0A9E4ZZ38_9EURY|nr:MULTISPECIES: hypothetical protein [Methanobacterium]MCZ3366977.1 hypothetical protein [Methanobacterium veterum]MCZ3373876.1 hypothetical protein [Methanobacterium veterum]
MGMNRVTISVPEDIDLIFRRNAAIKFAFRRGWYGKAILEAIQLWITHQTSKKSDISEEEKNYLWNIFKDKIDIDSDNPEEILDSVVQYFETDIKYAEKVNYRLNDHKIIVDKEDSLDSYLPQLIVQEDGSVYLSCIVENVACAAIKDITGQEYITSNSRTLLCTYESINSEAETQKSEVLENQANPIRSK